MKKSFVVTLALVFVLGIAGTAFAANPFTDVPANHWAYASVSKLAQAGIIDGYGDGKFIGNSNMTRYEMAQIVAKAMANSDKADAALKAQIEKLAAEFSAELNKLGVRVSTLEKKVDNVKITGEVRFSNYSYSDVKLNGFKVPNNYQNVSDKKLDTNDNSGLRTRLWLTGQVNDSWKYTAMIENIQDLQSNTQDATTEFRRAWVEGKIGAIGVTAGRFNYLSLYGTVLDDASDGLVLNYTNNKFSMDVFSLRPELTNDWLYDIQNNVQVFGTQINYNFTDKWHAGGTYYNLKGKGGDFPSDKRTSTSIIELGVDYKFDKNWFAWANYIRGGKTPDAYFIPRAVDLGSKNGWAAGVNFGNTDREKPGSYQIRAAYYDVPALGSISTTVEFSNFANLGFGFKGYNLGASYMVAKNIDVNVDYFDFKTTAKYAGHKADGNLLWSYVRFYF